MGFSESVSLSLSADDTTPAFGSPIERGLPGSDLHAPWLTVRPVWWLGPRWLRRVKHLGGQLAAVLVREFKCPDRCFAGFVRVLIWIMVVFWPVLGFFVIVVRVAFERRLGILMVIVVLVLIVIEMSFVIVPVVGVTGCRLIGW